MTDFAKVPNASADGANVGANVANAANAVSGSKVPFLTKFRQFQVMIK